MPWVRPAGRAPPPRPAARAETATGFAHAWRLLADQLDAAGDAAGADQARAHYMRAATRDPRLMQAAAALVNNQLPVAEARLRAHLQAYPSDVAALRMLAEVAARLRRYADAQQLLERCLELAPSFDAARHNYAMVLNRQGNAAAALSQVERLLAQGAAQPRLPQPAGRGAGEPRRLRRIDQGIRGGARRIPAPAQGLAELWALTENRRPPA